MVNESLLRRVLSVVRPPAINTSHAAVGDSLVLPDGPRQGKPYRWREDPIHLVVIRELDQGWDSLVLVGAVQTGKSLVSILVPALRQLIFQRRAVVYAQPSQQKLHEAWTGKVSPAITGAGLGGWLPTEGQGARGGQTPRFVVFRDPVTRSRAGMLYLIHGGGRNEGAQASVSAATVLVDEVDSFQSAHRVALIGKRADAFGAKAVRIYTSTVKADGLPGSSSGSIILGMYADSTRSRLWFSCPHCSAWQKLDWDRVTYDATDEGTAAESCRISCTACAVAWAESDRQKALQSSRCVAHSQTVSADGTIAGALPRTRRFGLLWTAIDSSLRDLPTLAIEHWRATQAITRGDHGLMRSFVRDHLCRPYEEPPADGEISSKHLAERSSVSTSTKRSVPAWVKYLTIGQDPGKFVHYWLVQGHGPDGRWCIIDWGYERVVEYVDGKPKREPTDADRLDVLNIIRDKANSGWQVEGTERRMRPVQRGVDIGFEMDLIVSWLSGEPEWKAMRGLGDPKQDQSRSMRPDGERAVFSLAEEIQRTNSLTVFRPKGWRQHIYGLIGDTIRHNVHAGLLRQPGDAGSGQIPAGLKANDMLLLHLCGEVWCPPEIKGGKQIAGYWSHPHGGWDLLDCLRYSHALSLFHIYHPDYYDSGDLIPEPTAETEPANSWLGNNTRWNI